MKTTLFILLMSVTVSAQSLYTASWLEKVTDDIETRNFFETIEITSDFIYIPAQIGDRIALWDNSGVVLFDHAFASRQEFYLPIGYLLSGTYHLGFKRGDHQGKFTSWELAKGGNGMMTSLIKE